MIELDLFGPIRLVRNWGFVGSKGQEKVEVFPDEAKAAEALKGWAHTQRDGRAMETSEATQVVL
ncbi:WGR domain-containing protein [Microvirga lotononidis]|uniref:WGR domain-containing protein n=1 Tax=Microvirga lotononidis TaxID=864069 RepID=I4Z376_9HYPH|nr:WGR domain-containing protein [Microvirga lotononidis]EIM30668.1 hypothetical protein MicloDRAFT_00005710 [Microvirga lotononidis]WQO30357.1 WGR domain-containing protein [Microvirga lotononidis]